MKIPKTVGQCPKVLIKTEFFPARFFPLKDLFNTQNAVSIIATKNNFQKTKNVRAISEKDQKTYFFQKKNFLKLIMRIPRLHFWKPRRKLSDKRATFFKLNVWNYWENVFLQKNSPKFLWHADCIFDDTATLLEERRSISAKCPKMKKKLQNRLFLEIFDRECRIQFWETRTKF